MKSRSQADSDQFQLLDAHLDRVIDPRQPSVLLAVKIDWAQYEFGHKVSVTTSNRGNWILGVELCPWQTLRRPHAFGGLAFRRAEYGNSDHGCLR